MRLASVNKIDAAIAVLGAGLLIGLLARAFESARPMLGVLGF